MMLRIKDIVNSQSFGAKTQHGDVVVFKALKDSYLDENGVHCVECTGNDDYIYKFDEGDEDILCKVVLTRVLGKSNRYKHIWVDA